MIVTYISKSIDTNRLTKYAEKLMDRFNWGEVFKGRNQDIILVPKDYPNSITNVAFCLSVSRKAIVQVDDKIDRYDAELALAIEHSDIEEVELDYNEYSNIDEYKRIFKDLLVTKGKRNRDNEDFSTVAIVKSFIGKGVGTIVIGFNKNKIEKGQTLYLYPSGKPVLVRGIQLMDVDVKEVEDNNYIGLALGNAREEEAKGALLSTNDLREHNYTINKDPLFKDALENLVFIKRGIKIIEKDNKLLTPLFKNIHIVAPSLNPGKNRIVGEALLV